MSMSKPTNDHREIRSWAVTHGAMPVEIGTRVHDGETARIGFVFPKAVKGQPEFKLISWEAFFALFDLLSLSLVYDDGAPLSYELLRAKQELRSGFGVGPS